MKWKEGRWCVNKAELVPVRRVLPGTGRYRKGVAVRSVLDKEWKEIKRQVVVIWPDPDLNTPQHAVCRSPPLTERALNVTAIALTCASSLMFLLKPPVALISAALLLRKPAQGFAAERINISPLFPSSPSLPLRERFFTAALLFLTSQNCLFGASHASMQPQLVTILIDTENPSPLP